MRELTVLLIISLTSSAWSESGIREIVAATLISAGPQNVTAMGIASLNRLAAPVSGMAPSSIEPQSLDLLIEHLPDNLNEQTISSLSMPARLEAFAEAAGRAEASIGDKIDEAVRLKLKRKEQFGTPTEHDNEALDILTRHRVYLSPSDEYKVRFLSREHLSRVFDNTTMQPRFDQADAPTERSGSWPERESEAHEERNYGNQAKLRINTDAQLRMLHDRLKSEDSWAADWLTAKIDGLKSFKKDETSWLDHFSALIPVLRNPNFRRAVELTQGPIVFRTRGILTGAYYHPTKPASKEKGILASSLAIAAVGMAIVLNPSLGFIPAVFFSSSVFIAAVALGFATYLGNLGSERRLLGRKGGIILSPTFSTDMIVHELAHRFDYQILSWFPQFKSRIERLYADAIKHGKMTNPYAATNVREYFAVGLQAFFTYHGIGFMGKRSDLKEKDPGLFILLNEIFGPYAKPIPNSPSPDYLANTQR